MMPSEPRSRASSARSEATSQPSRSRESNSSRRSSGRSGPSSISRWSAPARRSIASRKRHERHLRAAADLENYKRRAGREKEEVERFGIQKLLKDLLPVIDNLDRALEHGEVKGPLGEGVAATRRIFEETLGRYGVKGFSSVGEPFDPNRHEAMQQVATAEMAPGTVVSEMVRGYMLHDRLVRPALVSVAVAPAVLSATTELPPEASSGDPQERP